MRSTFFSRNGSLWVPQYLIAIDGMVCIGCGRCFKVCSREVMHLYGVDDAGEILGACETTISMVSSIAWSWLSTMPAAALAAVPAAASAQRTARPMSRPTRSQHEVHDLTRQNQENGIALHHIFVGSSGWSCAATL